MMVTPVEALDLLHYLQAQGLLNEELLQRCQQTIEKFRLDQGLGNGRRSFLRRTYTCPFFGFRELGCPLPQEFKPYGCLAFNPHDQHQKAASGCFSEVELLKQRDADFPEEEKMNEELRSRYQLSWEKISLPQAILELAKKISSADQ
jgi:hypothetical protein